MALVIGIIVVAAGFGIGLAGRVLAEVVINEVSPAADPEWVELYNNSTEKAELAGCRIYFDDSAENQWVEFEASLSTPIEKFFVVEKGSPGWSSNWLNNGGDEVRLVCGDFSDRLVYESSKDGFSWGRYPDGGNIVETWMASTKGNENAAPVTPTPQPTATSTPTPKPTATGTAPPTATAKSTTKPKETAEVKATSTAGPTATAEVLGESDDMRESDEAEEISEERKLPYFALGLAGSGALLFGISLYPLLRSRLKKYNGFDEKGGFGD